MTELEKGDNTNVSEDIDELYDIFGYFSLPTDDEEEGSQDSHFNDDAAMVEFKANRKQLLKEAVERLKTKKETK